LDLELLKTDLRENKLCKLAKNLQLDADKRKIIYFDPNNKYACPQTFAFIEYVISSEEKKQDAAPFSARNLENVLI
jgi:hypothetical protein